jgi:hypothetical protein
MIISTPTPSEHSVIVLLVQNCVPINYLNLRRLRLLSLCRVYKDGLYLSFGTVSNGGVCNNSGVDSGLLRHRG